MASWLLKATVQGGISHLPGRHRLNYLLQRYATRSVLLTEAAFEAKVGQCCRHLQRYRRTRGTDVPPACALELGTGWYPIIPVGLLLCGVAQVHTVDVHSLLDGSRVQRVLELYAARVRSGQLDVLLPDVRAEAAEAVLAAASDPGACAGDQVLSSLGVHAHVGGAWATPFAAESVELLVSNNTLEHIPAAELAQIMNESRRLAAAGAVMDHFIDMSDHYAHFDRSINEFNFLRYSERTWRLFNNSLQYQNRLRVCDYRRIIESAGFRVVATDAEQGQARDLERIGLAQPFLEYDRGDLLALRAWMTAVLPAS